MRSTCFCCITHYLVPIILIGLTHGVPLDGKKVRDAKVDELPFVVSLELRGHKGSHFCVGTLISRQSVLTAAHCLFNLTYDKIDIMIGSTDLRGGTRYQVKSWISYDRWTSATDDLQDSVNDIAVITLNETVEGCEPAAILTFSRQGLDSSKVRIAGWGLSKNGVLPMILKTAVLRVIPNNECSRHIESLGNELYYIPETYFCTKADPWVLGGCGDSGAPILNKQKQVVGIHYGVCPMPSHIREYYYTKEFVNQHTINLHLHLHHFRNFISAVKI